VDILFSVVYCRIIIDVQWWCLILQQNKRREIPSAASVENFQRITFAHLYWIVGKFVERLFVQFVNGIYSTKKCKIQPGAQHIFATTTGQLMNPLLYPMTAQVVHPILYPHLYLVPPYVGRHLERGHLLTKMEV
jgi:hypothetical protein